MQLSPDDYLQGVIGASNELVSLGFSLALSLFLILKSWIGKSKARLAMNAVTLRNFSLPLRIATFEKDLFAGFSIVCLLLFPSSRPAALISENCSLVQLNLRNDALRRRFDSLKYDVKRCEDVVYDITLRNLAPPPAGQ